MTYQVENHGSLCLVKPLDDEALSWLNENVEGGQWWGGALAVEPRYLENLLDGMDGLQDE